MSRQSGRLIAGTALALGAAAGGYALWARRSGAAAPARVGYPPLDALKPLDDGLWLVDSTIVAAGLTLPIRMTIIRLGDGSLVLHSPTRYTAPLGQSLAALGTVRHLIAPSIAHWSHLSAWQGVFPEATTWAVPGLRERAQVRRSKTRIDHDLGESAPPDWRDELGQTLVRGGGFVEAALFHKASGTLILCDLIENLESAKLPPFTRLLAAAAFGTRGTTALHVRAAVVPGGEQARSAVRSLVALEPRRVILAHGRIFEHDAAERLRQAFAWLL